MGLSSTRLAKAAPGKPAPLTIHCCPNIGTAAIKLKTKRTAQPDAAALAYAYSLNALMAQCKANLT